jgi:hypothetical protein
MISGLPFRTFKSLNGDSPRTNQSPQLVKPKLNFSGMENTNSRKDLQQQFRSHEGLAEQVKKIQRRFEVNGWDLHEVLCTMNRGRMMIFTKPEGTPDVRPFVEPNVKE